MEIKFAEIKDLLNCYELGLNTKETPFFKELKQNMMIDYLKDYLKYGIFLVAIENDEIIGFITGEYMLGKHIYVDFLIVKSNFRSLGIGKKLFIALQEIGKKRNYIGVYLVAPADNIDTIKFYEKLGLRKGSLVQEMYYE